MNRTGQLSIVNIVFFVILVAVSAIMTPVMGDFITQVQSSGNYSALTNTAMDLVLPMFWLGVIITFFLYVVPVRPQQF